MNAMDSNVSVVIRLGIGSPSEHWRDEPWVYAKALKWFKEEADATAEAERLNRLDDDPLYVYFVSHPKPGTS